jgi:hypothetical protein
MGCEITPALLSGSPAAEPATPAVGDPAPTVEESVQVSAVEPHHFKCLGITDSIVNASVARNLMPVSVLLSVDYCLTIGCVLFADCPENHYWGQRYRS